MTFSPQLRRRKRRRDAAARGFSLVEISVVVLIAVVLAAIAIPSLISSYSDIELRSAAAQVSDLMQQARILAAKNNTTYPVRFQLVNGVQRAYIDFNNNGAWDVGEPVVDLGRQIIAAAGAPSGANGQPAPFVLPGDTTVGNPCDNTCVLAFSSRGLPCNYTNPPTCTTPAATFFVYYLQDNRPVGWSAVAVSKAGRTKVILWNGTAWR